MERGILPEQEIENAQNLVKLVRKWGDVNSEALLEENCHTFFMPEIEGFIGYKIESKNAVVFGDPVCAPQDKPILAKAFDRECQRLHLKTVYIIASQDFAKWATDNLSAIAVEFGMKFALDPQNNPSFSKGQKASLVRNRMRRALSDNVVVQEYLEDDPSIERQLEEIATNWLKKRQGPQIYLSKIVLFRNRYGKRWFYARKGDNIVALLWINELQSQNGWMLNNIMMIDDAPKGISELLIVFILETLRKEGCRVVLGGPVPAKQLGKISGIGKIKAHLICLVFKIGRYFFNLDGRAIFWNKFQPQFQSSFLLFPHRNLKFSSIKALMRALNANV